MLTIAQAAHPGEEAIAVRRRRWSPKRDFAAGLLTGREDARLDAAMAGATEAYAKLAKLKPFWR